MRREVKVSPKPQLRKKVGRHLRRIIELLKKRKEVLVSVEAEFLSGGPYILGGRSISLISLCYRFLSDGFLESIP